MTQPVSGSPNPAGERWNVNLPAVIGLVFVLLVGVVVWVVVSSGGDDDDAAVSTTSTLATVPATDGSTTTLVVAQTTSPAPMPDPSAVATSVDAAEPPVTTSTSVDAAEPPVTTAPGADDGAVLGDLAVPGRPMQRPGCDDSFITVLASAVGAQATAVAIGNVLDTYPGSNYLRTDQTCPSLTPDIDGEPIYVVYLGPFAFASDACAARAEGPQGSYARKLSTEVGPDHGVDCA